MPELRRVCPDSRGAEKKKGKERETGVSYMGQPAAGYESYKRNISNEYYIPKEDLIRANAMVVQDHRDGGDHGPSVYEPYCTVLMHGR